MAIDEREYFDWYSWAASRTEIHFSEFHDSGSLVHTLHTHDFYELVILLRGSVGHKINGEEMTLEAGHVVFIRPDDQHCFYDVSDKKAAFHFVNIEISRSMFEQLSGFLNDEPLIHKMVHMPQPPTLRLSEMQYDQLKSFLANLSIHYCDEHQNILRIRAILPQLCIWYADYLSRQSQQHLPAWFASLCDEMKKPENFTKGVDCLTAISRKSHGYLCHCFRKYLNTSPTDFLNTVRMNYCAYLLRHTQQDILDIMLTVGFESTSHFYRLFQKEYQMTPAKYRKRSAGELTSYIVEAGDQGFGSRQMNAAQSG